ncbi:unnamed protein product [Phyllotreta striolata]|uniref:Ferritin n=1 Tax=Phyllotreta striolata TaxID=444603 RepID=A0A9N9TSU5_PHYSR|nr:unnamed protein product [Phyllotreta striolata]
MKVFIILSIFCAAAFAEDYCYKDARRACGTKLSLDMKNCTAKYGAIERAEASLQKFAYHHFIRSFDYLLLSTHFANYQKNRPGFEKLFRDLSDNKWHEGIELIKYITSRGGEMQFNDVDNLVESEDGNFDLHEITAIAKALDIEKKMANEASEIHHRIWHKSVLHDPEITDYIEKEFVHKEKDLIRKLAGYSTDLKDLLNPEDGSLSLFLFDEFLQGNKLF